MRRGIRYGFTDSDPRIDAFHGKLHWCNLYLSFMVVVFFNGKGRHICYIYHTWDPMGYGKSPCSKDRLRECGCVFFQPPKQQINVSLRNLCVDVCMILFWDVYIRMQVSATSNSK